VSARGFAEGSDLSFFLLPSQPKAAGSLLQRAPRCLPVVMSTANSAYASATARQTPMMRSRSSALKSEGLPSMSKGGVVKDGGYWLVAL
jgi:hypothetical protein